MAKSKWVHLYPAMTPPSPPWILALTEAGHKYPLLCRHRVMPTRICSFSWREAVWWEATIWAYLFPLLLPMLSFPLISGNIFLPPPHPHQDTMGFFPLGHLSLWTPIFHFPALPSLASHPLPSPQHDTQGFIPFGHFSPHPTQLPAWPALAVCICVHVCAYMCTVHYV